MWETLSSYLSFEDTKSTKCLILFLTNIEGSFLCVGLKFSIKLKKWLKNTNFCKNLKNKASDLVRCFIIFLTTATKGINNFIEGCYFGVSLTVGAIFLSWYIGIWQFFYNSIFHFSYKCRPWDPGMVQWQPEFFFSEVI